MTERYRVGTRTRVTVFDDPNPVDGEKTGRLMATAQTPEDAALIVAALNRALLTGWPARYFDAGIEDL